LETGHDGFHDIILPTSANSVPPLDLLLEIATGKNPLHKFIGNDRQPFPRHLSLFGATVQLAQPHLVAVQNNL